jgi:hypothetical protein
MFDVPSHSTHRACGPADVLGDTHPEPRLDGNSEFDWGIGLDSLHAPGTHLRLSAVAVDWGYEKNGSVRGRFRLSGLSFFVAPGDAERARGNGARNNQDLSFFVCSSAIQRASAQTSPLTDLIFESPWSWAGQLVIDNMVPRFRD